MSSRKRNSQQALCYKCPAETLYFHKVSEPGRLGCICRKEPRNGQCCLGVPGTDAQDQVLTPPPATGVWAGTRLAVSLCSRLILCSHWLIQRTVPNYGENAMTTVNLSNKSLGDAEAGHNHREVEGSVCPGQGSYIFHSPLCLLWRLRLGGMPREECFTKIHGPYWVFWPEINHTFYLQWHIMWVRPPNTLSEQNKWVFSWFLLSNRQQ